MTHELSKSQINRLGDRLRKGQPLVSDLEILDKYRRSFDDAYEVVVRALRGFGEPTGRIKTTISIVEKLKRESIRLSKLQDIAGCRIVVDDIEDQERVIRLVVDAFPTSVVIDRRDKLSHGYRAMHVVADVDGRLVEIQIRTELQHVWAVWSETLADVMDHSIKYGGGPKDIQEILTLESEIIALMEEFEQRLAVDLTNLDKGPALKLNQLHEMLAGKSLPLEVIKAMRLLRDMKDLVAREQEVKDRLTHEILKLEVEKRNP